MALFGYAHVPWIAKRQRMIPQDVLPGAEDRLAQARMAALEFEAAGFGSIGHDHFALPDDALAVAAASGRLRRNFQGYTDDDAETLIGVGVSAISKTMYGYAQNLTETGAWGRVISSGALPVARGHRFVRDDLARGRAIEMLMCYGSADLGAIATQVGSQNAWVADALGRLEPLIVDGVVRCCGERIEIDSAHNHLTRIVASALDAYFQSRPARHSFAV